MKVVSKEAAMVMLLVLPDEVRPLAGYYLTDVLLFVGERYQAEQRPTVEEAGKGGARFRNGRFVADSKSIFITELAIFNDGFSVTTSDTADSELVLNDLLRFLKEQFQFRDPVTRAARIFQSDVVVDLEGQLDRAVVTFEPVLQFMQGIKTAPDRKPQLNRITFTYEPTVAAEPLTEFTLERRVGAPWSLNRYFSKAHMRTGEHIQALELLEQTLASSN